MNDLPLVAIIGRPNVGKSTLFNRLSRTRKAIVDKIPGVTRDRNYAKVDWNGQEFILVDTGGLLPEPEDGLEKVIARQAELAVREADLIIFLTERDFNPLDQDIANFLRKSKKKVILAVNKIDSQKFDPDIWEFSSLGLGDPLPVSALNGRNTGNFLDALIQKIPVSPTRRAEEELLKIAVLGRPNVGKSSYLNKLMGEEKLIVNDKPGTTRDAVDTLFTMNGQKYLLTDTAGLNKKQYDLEYYGSLRTINALKRSDIAILIVDITEGFVEQDKRIAAMAINFYKGLIIALNKWDLVENNGFTLKDYTKALYREAPFLSFAPVMTISALTGKGVLKVLELAGEVFKERSKRYSTSEINQFIEELIRIHPPAGGRHRPQFLYVTQQSSNPPTFIFFVKGTKLLQANYKRYIRNKLRERYGFVGTPLKIVFRENK
ncbi:ribosome biogenesis GTPase Der [bacterium]|nr:ribosome biogenesis GTPase Der [bacterium]